METLARPWQYRQHMGPDFKELKEHYLLKYERRYYLNNKKNCLREPIKLSASKKGDELSDLISLCGG